MTDQKLPPGLYVAATPIGNLADVSRRLEDILNRADLVLCEDTRVTGKLLSALGLPKRTLKPYHEHNAEAVRPLVLGRLDEGAAIALVSDAGTPLISDPGYRIVREAKDAGHRVVAVPGPSALTAALSIAGAPTDRFTFIGFLPKGPGQKRNLLAEFAARRETLVTYETGPRLASTLEAVAETLGDRRIAVARELTKLHEEVVEGSAAELAARYADSPPRGEIVLVIHPASGDGPGEADLDGMVLALLGEHSVKETARLAAEATGLSRKECYARALALRTTEG